MSKNTADVVAIRPLTGLSIPQIFASSTAVQAGWPSPAQDYFDGRVDLNTHLIKDANSTFIVRVAGDSMRNAGISDGDEVIVDRALTAQHGDVVVAVLDGELTLKRLWHHNGQVILKAENPRYPDIAIASLSELTIWGVVTRCLHHV
jgi:DNA polymerase V